METLCTKVETVRYLKKELDEPIEEVDEKLYNILDQRVNDDPHTSKTFGTMSTKKEEIKKNKPRSKTVDKKEG